MLALFFFFLSVFLVIFNKFKESLLMFFIYTLNGLNFIGANYSLSGVSFQPSDLSIGYCLLLFFVFVLKKDYLVENREYSFRQFKGFLVFAILIGIESIADLMINNVSIIDIYKTNRQWILLSFCFLIIVFTSYDLDWVLKCLVIITLFQLIIFFFQPILGYSITEDSTRLYEGIGSFDRYINFPALWFFSFWYIFFSKGISVNKRLVFCVYILLCMSITLSRSLYLSVFFGFMLLPIITPVSKSKLFIGFILSLSILFSFDEFRSRVSTGYDEIAMIVSGDVYLDHTNDSEQNMLFRALHLSERINHMSNNTITFMLGYGFITESNFTRDIFSVGLKNEDGNVIQLDTGDIAWSLIFVRYGFLGFLTILVINLTMLFYFFQNRISQYAKLGFIYLGSSFVTSMAYMQLATSSFYLIPIVLCILIYRERLWQKLD